jgi:hypothetical protein
VFGIPIPASKLFSDGKDTYFIMYANQITLQKKLVVQEILLPMMEGFMQHSRPFNLLFVLQYNLYSIFPLHIDVSILYT